MKPQRLVLFLAGVAPVLAQPSGNIGREVAIERHLKDGEEFQLSIPDLLNYGKKLFVANWTIQEGAGRPLSKGTGDPISDRNAPLVFPRNFNRISGPDANSCAGCHNQPLAGGGGDIVTNVFVLGQRFDAATLDFTDAVSTRGGVDERGKPVTLLTIANSRHTPGMFGSGFIEMLARQMTAGLRSIRDSIPAGGLKQLAAKGVSFGVLARDASGAWDTSKVEGLPAVSLVSASAASPPSLVILPFHQAGRVVSIREFTNNAFNHHHGMQSTERFGVDTDPDGDEVTNELTRADITAAAMFQAAMAVPGRVVPEDPDVQNAVHMGEQRFASIGCARCHVPSLPLDKEGWIYSEPNLYNPMGNLRPGDAPVLEMDLTSDDLPRPRLKPENGVVNVPAFTDLKLHDICSGPGDPNVEPLDMQQKPGSVGFFTGNCKFVTRKLWGIGALPPYYHHGQFTTMREAILAHAGEALEERQAFQALNVHAQNDIVEFLKTLQVLPAQMQ